MTHPRQRSAGPRPESATKRDMRFQSYKTLQQLKNSSPSRKHGLGEEDEERWKRTAINLIITAGASLKMDHLAVITALEFFHRFYAQYSMVTNDRFLMAMACMYLGGKVADAPKSCRDIISACTEAMCPTREEASRLRNDTEWIKATKEAVSTAERALLYQLGFRFSWTTAPGALVDILIDQTGPGVATFLGGRLNDDERQQFNQMCIFLANQSAKVPLALQYPSEAIAAACIWLGMKMLKIDGSSITPFDNQPWYYQYGLRSEDLGIIADQISASVVSDVKAAEEVAAAAVSVKAEFHVQWTKGTPAKGTVQ